MNRFLLIALGIVVLVIVVLVLIIKSLKGKLKKTEDELKEKSEKLEQTNFFYQEKKEYEKAKENFRDNSIDSANATVEFLQKLSDRGKDRNK